MSVSPGSPPPPLAASLGLQPHPEGGWFRQTWAASTTVSLPDGRVRPTATLILFLLAVGECSAWHRVASDETWLAHRGVVQVQLGGSGAAPEPGEVLLVGIGADGGLDAGWQYQVRVPAGVWQQTLPASADALVSCLVSPGFDFDDFELD